MNEPAQRETPQVGIFWLVQATEDEARLLTAGCPLDQAEPYGDCLTYGPGHYETWARRRRARTVEPVLRAKTAQEQAPLPPLAIDFAVSSVLSAKIRSATKATT
jgi:hypothetical protein